MASQTWTSGACTVTLNDKGVVIVTGNGALQDYTASSDQPWYSSRTSMRKLVIKQGVTGIGNNCFRDTSIREIEWPASSLTAIWHSAFLNTGLIWVSLPSSVTTWGNSIFQNCSSLSQVKLPTNMAAIPQGMFMNCTALGSISIPTSVESIGIGAFNNTGLTSVFIPDEVETIGSYAFQNCSALAFARVGMGYDGESGGVFANCTSLVMVAFAEGLMKIGNGMFNGCTALKSVVLPFTLRTIDQDAFRNCSALVVAVMSPSITSIGNNAFTASGLGRLVFQGNSWNNATIGTNAFASTSSNINVHSGGNCANGKLDGKGGNTYLYNDLGTSQSWTSGSCTLTINPISGLMTISGSGAMLDYPSTGSVPWHSWNGGTLIRAIKVGSGVTKIGNNAFYNDDTVFTGLNRVYWDSGGQANLTIGTNAFRRCYTLERLSLPSSCVGVGDDAFNGCRGLRSLQLPAQLTSLGSNAFTSNHSMTDLDMNLFTGSWDFSKFNYANSLQNITVDSANTAYSSVGGVLYSKDGQTLKVLPFGRVTYTVPSTATYIDANCARGGLLGKITIPNSVTGIGGQAFVGCTRLTSLELPQNCTGVSSIAFADCINIRDIYLHGSARYSSSPGSNAFNLNRNSSSTAVTCYVWYDGASSADAVRSYLGTYTNLTWVIAEASVTVTIQSNDATYGTVSQASVVMPYDGGTASISGNILTLTPSGGSAVTITASPAQATAQYTYAFGNWTGIPGGGSITEDCTIIANFTRTVNDYVVTIAVNDSECGSVSPTSVTVPYGAQIQTSSMNPNVVTIGGNQVTATRTPWTEGVKYYFDNWTGIPSPAYVTGALTITANFHKEAVQKTLSFRADPLGYGTVSPQIVTVDYGTPITAEGNVLTIGSNTVTATPLAADPYWRYVFVRWDNLPAEVTADAEITAVFDRVAVTWDVTIAVNQEGWGDVSETLVTVDGGVTWESSGDTLMFSDGQMVTAVPSPATQQYRYAFDHWEPSSGTVTGAITITAVFIRTLVQYTVTIAVNDAECGSVDVQTVTADYGTAVSAQANVLSIGSTDVTATASAPTPGATYAFDSWSGIPVPAEVTQSITITAVFTKTVVQHTVTFAAAPEGWGTVSPGSVTVDYGTPVTVSGNVLTIGSNTITATPSPTTPEWRYRFSAWEGIVSEVTDDITITADFLREENVVHVTIAPNQEDWGTLSESECTVPTGTSVSTMDNVLAIGTDFTCIAEPHEDTPQYRYGFARWAGVPPSGILEDDTEITALFTRTAVADWVEEYDAQCGAFGSDASMEAGEDLEPGTIVSVRGGLVFASNRNEPAVGVTVGEIPRGVLGPVRVHGVVRVTADSDIDSGRFVAAGGGGAAIQRITGASLGVALDSGEAGDRIRIMVNVARGS